MTIAFRHHDTLRLFVEIAQFDSFSKAAEVLNMTKGAISYQVKILEQDLGLELFERHAKGISLTVNGRHVLKIAQSPFREIEAELSALMGNNVQSLTVGMSSYFASRWLSPRLMGFMQKYPDIQLRIQPMTELFNLERQGVDLAIRWGNGDWADADIIPLMPMPAWPTGNVYAMRRIQQVGLVQAFSEFTLLRDHDDSDAWSDWFKLTGLPRQSRNDTLIVPDPNVRVQAVINGQGVALNDALAAREIDDGQLVKLSEIELINYGYFLVRPRRHALSVENFVEWILDECSRSNTAANQHQSKLSKS